MFIMSRGLPCPKNNRLSAAATNQSAAAGNVRTTTVRAFTDDESHKQIKALA
jgi:hypothetical protein